MIQYIKNMWFFRRELYNYRVYDYSFSLAMFKRGLEGLREEIRHDDVHLGAKRALKDITVSIALMDRLLGEKPYDPYDYDLVEDGLEFDIKITKNFDLPSLHSREKVCRDEVEGDMDYLFTLLRRKMRSWWV